MYEAKVNEISTGRIVLPSLLAFPDLRSLLQNIKEGDRSRSSNFQPDAGDPVMAASSHPNGITEEGGHTIIKLRRHARQLRWQHLRRFEYLSAPASGLYDRARSIWKDSGRRGFRSLQLAGRLLGGDRLARPPWSTEAGSSPSPLPRRAASGFSQPIPRILPSAPAMFI